MRRKRYGRHQLVTVNFAGAAVKTPSWATTV